MKIAFVHYTIGSSDGVNTVIHNNAQALLKKYSNVKIGFVGSVKNEFLNVKGRTFYYDIPELDISKKREDKFYREDVYEYLRNGERLHEKLENILHKYDVVIFENPNIGVYPAATYGFYRFIKKNSQEKKKRKTYWRLHDFPMDRRGNFQNILKFKGQEANPYWHKLIFPNRSNFSYIMINQSDMKIITSHGILDEESKFYIPNPLKEERDYQDEEYKTLKKIIQKKYNIPTDKKIIYYPVRIVERKNICEAIFITQLLNNKFDDKYHLIVSLKPSTAGPLKYYNKLKKFVEKNKLPVTLGIDMIALNRVVKGDKIEKYSVGDMYKVSDKIITTSKLEGFGMFFIESWYYKKPIIGRDLPSRTIDFKCKGIYLEHLYSSLFIDEKDFKDYECKDQMKYILKLKNQKFLSEFMNKNSLQFNTMLKMFDLKFEKEIIKNNHKLVKKYFAPKKIAEMIYNMIKNKPNKS